MSQDKLDREFIERIVSKSADVLELSIASTCHIVVRHLELIEGHLFDRLAETEDTIDDFRRELSDAIAKVRGDTRELLSEE